MSSRASSRAIRKPNSMSFLSPRLGWRLPRTPPRSENGVGVSRLHPRPNAQQCRVGLEQGEDFLVLDLPGHDGLAHRFLLEELDGATDLPQTTPVHGGSPLPD